MTQAKSRSPDCLKAHAEKLGIPSATPGLLGQVLGAAATFGARGGSLGFQGQGIEVRGEAEEVGKTAL